MPIESRDLRIATLTVTTAILTLANAVREAADDERICAASDDIREDAFSMLEQAEKNLDLWAAHVREGGAVT